MVVSFGDLRKGMTIEMDGQPYQVVEYSSHKMQQRAPVIRLRLRELRTGRTVERSFNGYDVKLNLAAVLVIIRNASRRVTASPGPSTRPDSVRRVVAE